jgi:alkanesulfonate monooxygenase SsuD/methylene tetrahydromethanopterin reductase-like flavin-dependent oxidoreductase (luciferase family)
VENYMDSLPPQERAAIADFLGVAVIGGPQTLREGLVQLARLTQADEFIMVSDVYEPELRLRSLELTAAAMQALPMDAAALAAEGQ